MSGNGNTRSVGSAELLGRVMMLEIAITMVLARVTRESEEDRDNLRRILETFAAKGESGQAPEVIDGMRICADRIKFFLGPESD